MSSFEVSTRMGDEEAEFFRCLTLNSSESFSIDLKFEIGSCRAESAISKRGEKNIFFKNGVQMTVD